jgi:type II secretory pathway pseudopilin PulG
MKNKLPLSRAMTLIETIVWVVMFASVMVTLNSSLLYFYRTNRYTLQQATAVSTAQHGMNIAMMAIRTASYASNGAYPIVSIDPNQFVFYSNVTPNDPLIQQVRLFATGTVLKEGITQATGSPLVYDTSNEVVTTIARYVRNVALATSTFTYFDNTNATVATTTYQKVRFVKMNLIVDVSTTTTPNSLVLTSSAALRNLINH